MFVTFGELTDSFFQMLMNLVTCGTICLILLAMGGRMILKANQEIRTLKKMEETI